MSTPILEKYKAVFIHVPKTGGVAIDCYLKTHCGLTDFTGHNAASTIAISNPEAFNNYFKFSFVRNPWERLVSAFFFLDQGGYSKIDKVIREKYVSEYNGDFTKFVIDLPSRIEVISPKNSVTAGFVDGLPFDSTHFMEQVYWLCDSNGKVLVDFVGRYENFQTDFLQVTDHLGLPPDSLPIKNKSKHGAYKTHYNDHTRSIVAKLFENDIDTFRYCF